MIVRSSLLDIRDERRRWARIRTGSDWIRTEANFGQNRTGSDCNFFWKLADQDLIGLRKYFLF